MLDSALRFTYSNIKSCFPLYRKEGSVQAKGFHFRNREYQRQFTSSVCRLNSAIKISQHGICMLKQTLQLIIHLLQAGNPSGLATLTLLKTYANKSIWQCSELDLEASALAVGRNIPDLKAPRPKRELSRLRSQHSTFSGVMVLNSRCSGAAEHLRPDTKGTTKAAVLQARGCSSPWLQ